MKVKYVEAAALCHATEDEARVSQALTFLTGSKKVLRDALAGVYGEPITLMKVVEKGPAAEQIYWRIISDTSNREKILDNLDMRLEGWRLHVRLDKQGLVKGEVSVASGDNTVKVVIGAGGKAEKGLDAKTFFFRTLVGQEVSHVEGGRA